MSIIEFFSQPLWHRLGLTLIHFLWQGLAVAIVVGTAVRLFRLRAGNARYCAYLLAFVIMAICPVITFMMIEASVEMPAKVSVTQAESRIDSEAFAPSIRLYREVPMEREAFVTRENTLGTMQNSTLLRQRFYNALESSLPWAIAVWIIGVILLSGRLLLGFVGVFRWRRNLKPLPEGLARRVVLLGERLGMRQFSRVFISSSAVQAMAIGYLRPLVLLPASMIARMQPEMLEAVIAHELAHIRRFDLWINLAQRIVENLLFYHPAVWWLSSRLRSEREFCCDELAIRTTGERLTYASALESAGRARFEVEEPALSLTFGQHRNSTLGRVRHVLGLPPAPSDARFWLAGIIAVVALAVLAMSITSILTARAQARVSGQSLHEAAKVGDIAQVESLISQGADLNAKDAVGRTALHCAVLADHRAVAQLLLSKGADLESAAEVDGTPLVCAAHAGNTVMVQLLIAKGADVNAEDARGNTSLHHIATRGRPWDILRTLIDKGANVNVNNTDGRTPAHLAAAGGWPWHWSTLLYLARHGTDLNAQDRAGDTVLHIAARWCYGRMWGERLLPFYSERQVDQTNAIGLTPLHVAAAMDDHRRGGVPTNPADRKGLVEGLIAKGANINAPDRNGMTPLHVAAQDGRIVIAQILATNGANLQAEDKHGHTPAYFAVRSAHPEVAGLLIDKGADVSSLYLSAYRGNLAHVKSLVNNGVAVNQADEKGFTPLHAAAAGGHIDTVEFLLSRGAEISLETQPGWTALSYAVAGNHMAVVELLRAKGLGAGKGASELLPLVARRGYIGVAKVLIELGAKVDLGERTALREATEVGHKAMVALLISKGADVNAGGWTPLHVAAQKGRIEIAKCLIAAGADIDAGNWTPLMEAAYYHKDMVKLLISEGADVNRVTKSGWSVLSGAVDEDRLDIAELLLESGAKPNVKGEDGSALHLAASSDYRPHFIDLLVAKGADVNARNRNGRTPLHNAGIRSMELLIAKGADINARTHLGETILHLAAAGGDNDRLKLALSKGVDINAKDDLGWTALHRAILVEHLDTAKLLVAEGANVHIKDKEGNTALAWAQDTGQTEIVELLKKHGAKE